MLCKTVLLIFYQYITKLEPQTSAVKENMASAFENRLNALREWPEKKLIYELTSFAEHHINAYSQICDVILLRLRDSAISISYKLPLIYLIDSILRNIAGPYVEVMNNEIVAIMNIIFMQFDEKDKLRFDYVVSTWETRRIFTNDVLEKLRLNILVDRKVNVNRYPNTNSIASRTFVASSDGLGIEKKPRATNAYPNTSNLLAPPNVPPMIVAATPAEKARREKSASFIRAVKMEMKTLFDKMNSDNKLGVNVESLQYSNSILYEQLKKTAEEHVHHAIDVDLQSMTDTLQVQPKSKASMDGNVPVVHTNIVKAYINEYLVNVDLKHALQLESRLKRHIDDLADPDVEESASTGEALRKVRSRLHALLATVRVPPDLPALVHGNLPLEPSKEFKAIAAVVENTNNMKNVGKPVPVSFPPFIKTNLERDVQMKDAALKALFVNRPFRCNQDGLRFKSEIELAQHLDVLFVKTKERSRKQASGERISRSWYCTKDQWVTDFNAFQAASHQQSDSNNSNTLPNGASSGASSQGLDENEEHIIIADEYFPRCPVSKEIFEHLWDEDDNEIYYRNAVKLLVTELSDSSLYQLSKPTLHPNIRYCIVHQNLVLDSYLESGKATSLRNAIIRYDAISKNELSNNLLEAIHIGREDSEHIELDNTFVVLEIDNV